jgi:hypothetical protein
VANRGKHVIILFGRNELHGHTFMVTMVIA